MEIYINGFTRRERLARQNTVELTLNKISDLEEILTKFTLSEVLNGHGAPCPYE